MEDLHELRKHIDDLDRRLIGLLAQRMDVVDQVGAFKRDNAHTPLRDDAREREVFEAWAREGQARGLSSYFVGRVLRELLSWSRRDQERAVGRPQSPARSSPVRVAYQGARASYSDLACEKLMASRGVTGHRGIGYQSFQAAADALEAAAVEYALLPVENTIAGSIHAVYDLLAARRLHVVDEEIWPVEHCLVGLPGARLEDLRAVRSHPVALRQCGGFLAALTDCHVEAWFDTAGACESLLVDRDATTAVIASEEAAARSGLEVLAREVADSAENFTRFLLVALAPEAVDPRRLAKTTLLFTVAHRHGALAECLQAFAQRGLSLTKLESRPLEATPWEYLFHADIEGNLQDERMAAALDEVRMHANHLRILGCYPRRSGLGAEPEAPRSSSAARSPEGPGPAPPSETVCPAVVSPAPARPLAQGTRRDPAVIRVGTAEIGAKRFALILGPCAVESRSQILEAAAMVKARGASMLRGGAFKPRSSPYSFQGMGLEGLALLAEAGRAYELPVVTEVLRVEELPAIAAQADVLQVGARNMQNFALLSELGGVHRPVLLKRGMSATIEELLLAAEYIMAGGNQQVVLCERGIRTFETATRATLDLSAVPVLKARTHLPVIVDPSHAAGARELVVPLALAAAAAGADGLIVEAHPDPAEALCDRDQALTPEDLDRMVEGLAPIVAARGLTLG